jgi:hypothetical protein
MSPAKRILASNQGSRTIQCNPAERRRYPATGSPLPHVYVIKFTMQWPHTICAPFLSNTMTFALQIPPGIPQELWALGPFKVISFKDRATPQKGRRYRMSRKERAELDKQTEYLLSHGWTRRSASEWTCNCIFAPKWFQDEDGLCHNIVFHEWY